VERSGKQFRRRWFDPRKGEFAAGRLAIDGELTAPDTAD
jgi:hypothetical protein